MSHEVHPRRSQSSLTPYLVISLVIHGLLFGLITFLILSEQRLVARQEDLVIADLREQERRQDEEKRKEQKDQEEAVKDLLAEQAMTEMERLIADQLVADDEQKLEQMTEEDIDERVEEFDETYDLDQLANEQFYDLSETLSNQAFGQMRMNLKQMKRDLLLSQVRAFIRSHVAPDIKEKIEQRLKTELGRRLKDEAVRQSNAERAERLKELGQDLKEAVADLNALAREQDQVRTDVRRARMDDAVRKQAALQQKEPATTDKVAAVLDKVAALSPPLAEEARALKDQPAERQVAPAIQSTGAAVETAREAHQRQAAIDAKKKPEEAKAARADTQKQQAHAETQAVEVKTRIAARVKDLQALSAKITQESRQPAPDEIQTQVVHTASKEVQEAVRKEVEKEVTETAIPVAAERIAKALEPELKKRKLDDQEFKTFLEKDIRLALKQETDLQKPEARVALMQTEQQFDLQSREEIEEARKEVAEAARKLRALAAEEEKVRDEAGEQTPADDARRQAKLAGKIRDTKREVGEVLAKARRATLMHDRQVSDAAAKVKDPAPEAKAFEAARTIQKPDLPGAKKQMTEVAQALKQSAAMLQTLEEGLAKEAAAVKARAETHVDLAKVLGDERKKKAVARVEEAADKVIKQNVKPQVAAAARSVDLKGLVGEDEALTRMTELEGKLDQIAENLEEGRGLGDMPGMDMAGPGVGLGLGGAGSSDGLFWPMRYGRAMSRFNRAAFEEFMKDMRDRLKPENYYAEDVAVDGLDSAAEPVDEVAAVIFVEALPEKTVTEPQKRIVPKPDFPTLQFGAAAMMEKPPVIDGDLSDWGELRHGLKLSRRNDGTRVDDGPVVHVRWSPDGLYIAYTLKDTDGIQHCKEYSWDGDCLEVMIDLPNSRQPDAYRNEDSQKFDFTPFGFKGRADITVCEMGRGLRGLVMAADYPDLTGKMGKAAGKLIPGHGYSVECFLSRRALAKPYLYPGKYIGINFIVNQNYETGTLWSCPPDFNTWRRPNTWGDLLLLGSDARLRFVGDDDKADQDVRGIVPNDPVYLEVADADMNVNLLRTDRVAATVRVKHASASLFAVLRETGPNTGVFRGSIHTQPYFMPPKENTLNVRSGDTLEFEYTDARAEFGEKNRKVAVELPVGWPVMTLTGKP